MTLSSSRRKFPFSKSEPFSQMITVIVQTHTFFLNIKELISDTKMKLMCWIFVVGIFLLLSPSTNAENNQTGGGEVQHEVTGKKK